jgi:hypothetical protein
VEQLNQGVSVSPIPGIRLAVNNRLDFSFTVVHRDRFPGLANEIVEKPT